MDLLRAQTISHPTHPNIEIRVSVHTPRGTDGQPKPDNPPYAVAEVYHRSSEYEISEGSEWKRIGRYRMEEFVALARGAAKIGKEMLPSEDIDEGSGEPD